MSREELTYKVNHVTPDILLGVTIMQNKKLKEEITTLRKELRELKEDSVFQNREIIRLQNIASLLKTRLIKYAGEY